MTTLVGLRFAHGFATLVVLGLFCPHTFGQSTTISTESGTHTSTGHPVDTDSLQACVTSHENARRALEAQTLLYAREALHHCADEGCPIAIRAECGEWLTQAELEVPTLVLSATTGEHDLERVRVTVDGRPLTERLNGEPVEASPGPHAFLFELPDGRHEELRIVVKVGEKNRVLRAEFAAPTPSITTSRRFEFASPSAVPLTPANSETNNSRVLLFGILSASSAAIAASLLFVGIDRRDATNRHCAPLCSDTQVSRVRRWFILADLAGAASVVTGGFGLYFYLDDYGKHNSKTTALEWQRRF